MSISTKSPSSLESPPSPQSNVHPSGLNSLTSPIGGRKSFGDNVRPISAFKSRNSFGEQHDDLISLSPVTGSPGRNVSFGRARQHIDASDTISPNTKVLGSFESDGFDRSGGHVYITAPKQSVFGGTIMSNVFGKTFGGGTFGRGGHFIDRADNGAFEQSGDSGNEQSFDSYHSDVQQVEAIENDPKPSVFGQSHKSSIFGKSFGKNSFGRGGLQQNEANNSNVNGFGQSTGTIPMRGRGGQHAVTTGFGTTSYGHGDKFGRFGFGRGDNVATIDGYKTSAFGERGRSFQNIGNDAKPSVFGQSLKSTIFCKSFGKNTFGRGGLPMETSDSKINGFGQSTGAIAFGQRGRGDQLVETAAKGKLSGFGKMGGFGRSSGFKNSVLLLSPESRVLGQSSQVNGFGSSKTNDGFVSSAFGKSIKKSCFDQPGSAPAPVDDAPSIAHFGRLGASLSSSFSGIQLGGGILRYQ